MYQALIIEFLWIIHGYHLCQYTAGSCGSCISGWYILPHPRLKDIFKSFWLNNRVFLHELAKGPKSNLLRGIIETNSSKHHQFCMTTISCLFGLLRPQQSLARVLQWAIPAEHLNSVLSYTAARISSTIPAPTKH